MIQSIVLGDPASLENCAFKFCKECYTRESINAFTYLASSIFESATTSLLTSDPATQPASSPMIIATTNAAANPSSGSMTKSFMAQGISKMFVESLPNIFKRAERTNQIARFTDHEAFVQRVVATSASCASIFAVLVALYFLSAIDPKRLVFRHQLISFLLLFDLLKACILLIYPTRVMTHTSSYYNRKFCQVVGFFTATAIEGADIAILSFALHTYLLIFKPSLNMKLPHLNRVEGGLYKIRWLVYSLSIVVPLVFASLAFINGTGYDSLVCWCYLPERPVWYRLVLSWVPRWCIVVAIFLIYGMIYFHVIKEFKMLNSLFTTTSREGSLKFKDQMPTFFASFRYFFLSVKSRLFPKLVLSEGSNGLSATQLRRSHNNCLSREATSSRGIDTANYEGNSDELESNEVDDLSELEEDLFAYHPDFPFPPKKSSTTFEDAGIQQASIEHFQKRQRIIQKQMKSIFIYPFAYCFIWLFPFILQTTQFNYEEEHKPVYWLNVLGAFMQPFFGFVDSMVFFYRERPWKYTAMKCFQREHKQRIDNIIESSLSQPRYSNAAHSTNTAATSDRIARNSLNAGVGLVDISKYRAWRRVLCKWKFPLFSLPTEANIKKYQDKYIRKKLQERDQTSEAMLVENTPQNTFPKINKPLKTYDGITMNNSKNSKNNSSSNNNNNNNNYHGADQREQIDPLSTTNGHLFDNILSDESNTFPLADRPKRNGVMPLPRDQHYNSPPVSPGHVFADMARNTNDSDTGDELDFEQFLKS